MSPQPLMPFSTYSLLPFHITKLTGLKFLFPLLNVVSPETSLRNCICCEKRPGLIFATITEDTGDMIRWKLQLKLE